MSKGAPGCLECGDFGVISAESDGYDYVFACIDCMRGADQPAIVTRWGLGAISRGFKRNKMWWDSLKQNQEGA
jgi:hypothetical protein